MLFRSRCVGVVTSDVYSVDLYCPNSEDPEQLKTWNKDPLDEVHHDNALWAYTMHAFEEWKNCNVTCWNDPIINQLFLMGCLDWTGTDNCMITGIQVMWFGVVVLSWVILLIYALEDKVHLCHLC